MGLLIRLLVPRCAVVCASRYDSELGWGRGATPSYRFWSGEKQKNYIALKDQGKA